MEKYLTLTKTCSSCGKEKPLSAFLQVGGTQGRIYGNICADCRKTSVASQDNSDDSDHIRNKLEYKIDSKVIVADDIDKKERFKEVEERYHEERNLEEEKLSKEDQKKAIIVKKEKEHRDKYIAKQSEKRSIFDSRRNVERPQERIAAEKIYGGSAQVEKESEINLSEAADLRAKYTHSPNADRLKSWLEPNAGLVSQAERAKIMADRARAEKKAVPDQEKNETISETIKRTFGRK